MHVIHIQNCIVCAFQVQATGAHKGLTYTLDSFSQQDFSIDAHTGIIYTTGPIDREDYVTRPSNSSYTFLPLLSSPGTLVERVEAEDMDTGMNSELLYFIIGGNPHGLFHISRRTGEITLTRELTRKHEGLHRLVVHVSDMGKSPQHSTALVHVFVSETLRNISLVESLVNHSLATSLEKDIAGHDSHKNLYVQKNNIMSGSLAGVLGVLAGATASGGFSLLTMFQNP